MSQNFDNTGSEFTFIGDRVLEEVIALDTRELAELGGNFEAIAKKMQNVTGFARARKRVFTNVEVDNAFGKISRELQAKYGKRFWENREALEKYEKGRYDFVIRALAEPLQFDRVIEIIRGASSDMRQQCPFGCDFYSNEEVTMRSKNTKQQLSVNSLTAHLARVHRLLEKCSRYGISAREFYESFM